MRRQYSTQIRPMTMFSMFTFILITFALFVLRRNMKLRSIFLLWNSFYFQKFKVNAITFCDLICMLTYDQK